MAKKEQEMYEGMPVIEASDSKGLKKKLEKLESRPEKYVVKISNRSTKIKAGAFMECVDIAALIISDSVTEIGECAFEDCTGLTSIVIPESVAKIGYSAFTRCTGLTSIAIPDSVTKIEDSAFYGLVFRDL